ncbi:acireductone dioxygenase [Ferroacidibacillus organovorans]|uniref:Acireductone dioxygenase n=1 Tax=Ferroacidibacillus organovorans TaxID=1765683 RepID=A0A1V4ES99_9BACL|nr:acireductone dioxygenase [Ferroacidibacillus organovorans]OPG15771.1 acireductone dioxygenase [Ferroacidibacillus organovorans]
MATIRVRNTDEWITDDEAVRAFLANQGVYYEQWDLFALTPEQSNSFSLGDTEKEAILTALAPQIEKLAKERGYVKWDVIALSNQTPGLEDLLKKFEQVHTHTEDEVRAIAAGSGIFIIKGSAEVGYFDVNLRAGDVISVPEHNPHFFTLTDERAVVAVRLFIDPAGWVAHPYADIGFEKA